MTSSSPSADPDPATAGFGAHESERIPLAGPFVSDMRGPMGGVYLHDMPVSRPARPRPKVKGVPGATSGDASGDYAPGQGTWSDAT